MSSRASLTNLSPVDLPIRKPLIGRDRTEALKEQLEDDATASAKTQRRPPQNTIEYEMPQPKKRERMVHFGIRMPISLMEELETYCNTKGIEQSETVRYFIAQGLKSVQSIP